MAPGARATPTLERRDGDQRWEDRGHPEPDHQQPEVADNHDRRPPEQQRARQQDAEAVRQQRRGCQSWCDQSDENPAAGKCGPKPGHPETCRPGLDATITKRHEPPTLNSTARAIGPTVAPIAKQA
jgi:hypothetical protein